MPKTAYAGALAAGLLAAFGVANQRVGLALAVLLLLLLLAAAASSAPPASGRPLVSSVGVALAVQPVLRDAGWVVALATAASLVAAGALATAPRTWPGLAHALVAPLRLVAGSVLLVRATAAVLPQGRGRGWGPALRGTVLAAGLLGVFGGLFVAADAAFAKLVEESLDFDVEGEALLWQTLLGVSAAAAAGSLAVAGSRPARRRPACAAPGVVELRIALGALVVLFLAFVAVQLQVLFGGAGYVRRTTGLGLGEYARQGFTEMLLVAALTLAVVAVAARQRDLAVRLLVGALCLLCLVVLASAHSRLDLVVDAYGLTRVRVFGEAVLPWLAALLCLALAAGAHPRIALRAPRIALVGSLVAVLALSVSDPDRRIAERAVDRHDRTGRIDLDYLSGLSADAIPPLRELPPRLRARALRPLEARLRRPDGLAGLNRSREGAR